MWSPPGLLWLGLKNFPDVLPLYLHVHSTLVRPSLATPFASYRLSWAALPFCIARNRGQEKRKPLLINKLAISQQWTEIRNGNELTLRRNYATPRRQSVWCLEKGKSLNHMLSFSIAKQTKPEKQSMRTSIQKCFRGSSNSAAVLENSGVATVRRKVV